MSQPVSPAVRSGDYIAITSNDHDDEDDDEEERRGEADAVAAADKLCSSSTALISFHFSPFLSLSSLSSFLLQLLTSFISESQAELRLMCTTSTGDVRLQPQ